MHASPISAVRGGAWVTSENTETMENATETSIASIAGVSAMRVVGRSAWIEWVGTHVGGRAGSAWRLDATSGGGRGGRGRADDLVELLQDILWSSEELGIETLLWNASRGDRATTGGSRS